MHSTASSARYLSLPTTPVDGSFDAMAVDSDRIRAGGLAYAAGFARLAMDLQDAGGLEETVALVVQLAPRVIPCDLAGVMLRKRGGRLTPAVPIDPRSAAAFQLEADCGEGPSAWLNAERCSVVVSDTLDDQRWPRWGPSAARLGVRSLLGIRLRTGQADLGLLNLCSVLPGRFADADKEAANLLACHASVAIAAAREAAMLALAIDARTVIGQAQGMLMERLGLDAAQSFAVLRRYSQDSNVRLHEVASTFIKTRQLPSRAGRARSKPV
ncbi:GAF and ANTAR domain-containing protein [Kribbella jiaozuonensis]|nr:GAF and ANTAR domain-containing protein [Kribbella jiaozuonensis]